MKSGPKAALGVTAIVGVLALGTLAQAYLATLTVSKCLSGKVKNEGKGAASYTGCYGKNASSPDAGKLSACLSKSSDKITSAFGKLDDKNDGCVTTGDGAARKNDTAAFASSIDVLVHNTGLPICRGVTQVGKCDAGKEKKVGKYVSSIAGCYGKAAGGDGTVSSGDPKACTDKALAKFQQDIEKLELKGGCTNTGQYAALASAADAYINAQTCLLDPTAGGCPTAAPTPTPTATATPGPLCGNGVVDGGEDCDPAGGPATSCQAISNTSAAFACSPACECPCPTKLVAVGDAFSPESVLDTGWTGISHRSPTITNGEVTVNVSSCAGSSRPCGDCNVSGPIANPGAGAGQLDSRRCTNDTSIRCIDDTPCESGCGTCEFFFGSNLALAAGGVATCVVNQFDGPVIGTANIESGEAATSAFLTARVYNGITVDSPCPQCIGDGAINDGTLGGTCDAGPRATLPCDGNGSVANRPDFGTTSLDCPPNPPGIIATLPIDLSNATDPVTMTLTPLSPNCSDGSNEKCLCDTCDNANAEPCESNADCPLSGGNPGVCGGRRCRGGSNNGAPCNNDTVCPGGGLCSRAGVPTKPSACLDDTATVNILDCTDSAPVDGEGECTQGPVSSTCSAASGHGQRACSVDGDCTEPPGGACPGCCVAANRPCFLTGTIPGFPAGPSAKVGTQTLVANGVEGPPMNDVSSPTLAAVFCVGPTAADAVNAVAGLPGPGRVTLKGTGTGMP